jgi:LEA14-like dessication related protein
MKKSYLFIGIGAAVILYFLSKSSAAKNLKVYFQTLSLKKSKGLNFPTVQAVFRIVNPTSSTLTIDTIAGDITVNNKFLSSLSQIDPISIPANSETLYTINIKTPIFNAITTVISLFKSKSKSFKVDFNGTVNSGGILLPINETVMMF